MSEPFQIPPMEAPKRKRGRPKKVVPEKVENPKPGRKKMSPEESQRPQKELSLREAEKMKELMASQIGSIEELVKQLPADFEPKEEVVTVDFSDLADQDRSSQRARSAQRVVSIFRAIRERQRESLAIFEPMDIQRQLLDSMCRVRLARGSNRSGKSITCAIEVARAVTGKDPHNKYPKEDGTVYIVTEEWGEVGRVIYPLLFKRGAFKIIKDAVTKKWRTFRPWDPEDDKRKHEAQKAEPLIPKRFIKGKIAWYKKSLEQPSRITLKNGWTLYFFSGESKPASGSSISLAWLDEEIPLEEWFVELNSRVAEQEGRILWSATPEIGTDQFHEFSMMAENQMFLPPQDRDVEEYKMVVAGNVHISERAKKGMGSMLSDADFNVRILGNFASSGRFIFPEFSIRKHGIDHFDIPPGWTYYAAIDPGWEICAVLFGAVPHPLDMVPVAPGESDRPWGEDPFGLVLFKELYLAKCDSKKFAEEFEKVVRHQDYEEFIIDIHGARQTQSGDGMKVIEHYQNALAKVGVKCRRTGSGFSEGFDEVDGGIEHVRDYLRPSPYTGKPTVRVMSRREHPNDPNSRLISLLPILEHELTRWKLTVTKNKFGRPVYGKPETKGPVHLCAAIRYLCSAQPRYVAPQYRKRERGPDIMEQMKRQQERAMNPMGRQVLGPALSGAR